MGGGDLLKMEKRGTIEAESDLLLPPKSHLFVCNGAGERSVTEEAI